MCHIIRLSSAILVVLWCSQAFCGSIEDANLAYQAKDYGAALSLYTDLAGGGNPEAQNTLGVMYLEGYGVKADPISARKWFEMAASQGHLTANYNLGVLAQLGKGQVKSEEKALERYIKAAQGGHVVAMYNAGVHYRDGLGVKQDSGEAVRWFKLSANSGYASAMNVLCGMYSQGVGIPQSYSEAINWCEKSAERGNGDAMYTAATILGGGFVSQPVPQSLLTSTILLERMGKISADEGRNRRLNYGRSEQLIRAHVWANLAASKGVSGAAEYRNTLAEHMSASSISKAEYTAMQWKPLP